MHYDYRGTELQRLQSLGGKKQNVQDLEDNIKNKSFEALVVGNKFTCLVVNVILWKLENVLKHKSCLDPQIKTYGSIDFTRTYTKCKIE